MQRFSAFVVLLATIGNFMMITKANADPNRSLTVTVSGLRNQKGQVCLSLFAQAQGFPTKSSLAVASRCISADHSPLTLTFNNLNPGNYAVALIHDENRDGKINTGFLGIPKEGFGFSRNPSIGFGAPRFEDAAIALTQQNTKTQIQVKYF